MLLNIVALVIVLGVLITVHEAGHFFAAKAVGVQVLRFAIGFGPPLVRRKQGETEYWLCAIPLGGYVKMAGLEDEGVQGALEGGKAETPIDPNRAFDRKPIWARFIVMIAGVTMNVLLGFVLYAGINVTLGTQEVGTTRIESVAATQLPVGAEALATLGFGDSIVAVNHWRVRTRDALARAMRERDTLRFEVAGRPEPLVVVLADSAARTAALRALEPLIPPRLGLIEPGRPAGRAGLRADDLVARANGDTVRSWTELVRAIRGSPGRPLRLDVVRAGTPVALTVVPDSQVAEDTTAGSRQAYGQIGVYPNVPITYVRQPAGAAVVDGARQTLSAGLRIVVFLKELLVGERSVRELGGPGLIANISGQVARLGPDWFLSFLAFFSVQLAVINLLPIPVLDGGHVVFLAAEALLGKPVPLVWRVRLLNLGFWFLVFVMLLAVGNDVLRFLP